MTSNNIPVWGLLGPEQIQSVRRTRTLEVGSAVRAFNDCAVPGMGGVWFGKQLMLSLLGVALAGRLDGRSRVRNIEMANAIEALACCLAFGRNSWKTDARLQGRRKMYGHQKLLFSVMRKSSFYVTQPMRMATIQPLQALGLVEAGGERFNAFRITPAGEDFLRISCGDSPVLSRLVSWVQEKKDWRPTPPLTQVLSPLEPLNPQAREFLQGLMSHSGQGNERRAAGLAWVKGQGQPGATISWDVKPSMISEDHWKDMHAGALFFIARDAALETLDELEKYMGTTVAKFQLGAPVPKGVGTKVAVLRAAASAFVANAHDPSKGIARNLCVELSNISDDKLLAALVTRDGRVLRLVEGTVLPGPAYRGAFTAQTQAQDDLQTDDEPPSPPAGHWPPGISRRLANLYLMNLDLAGTLLSQEMEAA